MRIVLYQPDIPQNTGAILRLAACMDVAVDVIGPTGFALGDRDLRRAGMDYADMAVLTRYSGWSAWQAASRPARPVLFTTRGSISYVDFRFAADDCLIFGQESAGVPQKIHEAVEARLCIPMAANRRSLNLAQAAAMALGEALRQTNRFPTVARPPSSDLSAAGAPPHHPEAENS